MPGVRCKAHLWVQCLEGIAWGLFWEGETMPGVKCKPRLRLGGLCMHISCDICNGGFR